MTPATKKASAKAEAEARRQGKTPEQAQAAGKQAAKDVRSRGTTTGGGGAF